jgi:hypothetical protein
MRAAVSFASVLILFPYLLAVQSGLPKTKFVLFNRRRIPEARAEIL